MTTVTYQYGRKFTFNPIYFANDLGDPWIFYHLNISFSLSNIILTQILKQFRRYSVDNNFLNKNWIYTILLKSVYLLLKLREIFKWGKHRGLL